MAAPVLVRSSCRLPAGREAPLDPKFMELLKLCGTDPSDMRRADIEKWQELGWNDDSIFDAVLVTSLL